MEPINVKKEAVKQPRMLTGEVVSNKMKDTIVVRVSRYRKHPKYGKFLERSKRFKVHDAGNTCSVGDIVFIREVKPISKDKHFVVAGKKVASRTVTEEVSA